MRLHLIIQRHGLPVTRILWTTSPLSFAGPSAAGLPASSSTITSTRTPNAAFSSGGYTIAQLLEDVNEVVPLETHRHPGGRNDQSGGQWGLEDYVVEVGGFECLHFMEVEGLLRDGDEVVIRALQTSDLRARRISGRLQISADGRHLIDGVPFGRPYLKRPFPSRPAVKIPPRKRRRISHPGWRADLDKGEEDADWGAPEAAGNELALFRDDYVDSDEESVTRHGHDAIEDVQHSESDADSEFEEDVDLTEELKGLQEDLKESEAPQAEAARETPTKTTERGPRLRDRTRRRAVPDESPAARSSSSVSHRHTENVTVTKPSPKTKNVRFQKGRKDEVSSSSVSSESEAESTSEEIESSDETETSTTTTTASSVSSTDESSSEEDTTSESEVEESTSESEEETTSESEEEESTSEEEDEAVAKVPGKAQVAEVEKPRPRMNPPGYGSERTKKSNRRNKMRRRLAKLKELGLLPPNADFAALRAYEESNKVSRQLSETKIAAEEKPPTNEQLEFEAKRQKLLRDLASGGVDVDGYLEKENVAPAEDQAMEVSTENNVGEAEAVTEPSRRPTLDVASSKRLLFGSLGVRAPKTKEDEEATREKLAGKITPFHSQRELNKERVEEPESDSEENWQDKLTIKATECVYDDIELTAPPFPFEQRWDIEAHEIIRQRKGWGKKKGRKRKQRPVDVEGEEEYEYNTNGYSNGLSYDEEQTNGEINGTVPDQEMQDVNGLSETKQGKPLDDLPPIPENLTSIPDLVESEARGGTIIAFKQLDMSKATNWQPRVSDYRVAQVDDVLENGTIKIRLAKRDREQRKEAEAMEEGPRQYSGFEMPGYEDEIVEDDGFRELSFGELIEPKLLQAAAHTEPARHEGDAQNGTLPGREDDVQDENEALSVEMKVVPVDPEFHLKSSQLRKEISQLLQDAGFRSDIDSDILGPDPELLTTKKLLEDIRNGRGSSLDDDDDQDDSVVRSPTFVGFPSSPPSVGSVLHGNNASGSRNSTPKQSPRPEADGEADDQSNQSPKSIKSPSPKSNGATPNSKSNPKYPMLPHMSDDAPQNTDGDNCEKPDDGDGNAGDDDGYLPEPRCGSPPPGQAGSDPLLSTIPQTEGLDSQDSSTVPNPFYEVDKAYEERRGRQKEESQEKENGKEAQFELPPFEALFTSTAPPRTATKSSSPPPERKRKALSSPVHPSSQVPLRSSSKEIADDTSGVDSQLVQDRQPDFNPGPSQASEIVDLTLSSPPQSPGGSDEDFERSQGLPRGPGRWKFIRLEQHQHSASEEKEATGQWTAKLGDFDCTWAVLLGLDIPHL
ncbi:hypothetical protein VTN00DRAFT_3665 [Thermoascus crustaceus]|uniref:uncharacterized protein n=1 Tax=Thermoascus crustaceus TaxID=5088 RepID=UPI00374470E1